MDNVAVFLFHRGFKGRPNFKKLSEGNRLVLLIGLENSKRVRNLVARKRVRLIDYSAIAAEVQGDEAIEDWQTFQLETNNLFYIRVKSALSKGIAVVDRNFRNLEIRLGFLEVSSISGSIESVLLVDRKLLQKDSYFYKKHRFNTSKKSRNPNLISKFRKFLSTTAIPFERALFTLI